MTGYRYTTDWFYWAPTVWTKLIPHMPERKRFLEIGSFEGRSTVWTIDNLMEDGGCIYAIDTWEGGEEHSANDMTQAESNFEHNTALIRLKHPDRYVAKIKCDSRIALCRLVDEKPFDFIYVDGSHRAKDVMTDACIAWGMLRPGGIMVFDDYMWGDARDLLHRPKLAVDAFTNLFAEEGGVIHSSYQLVFKKKD